MHGIEYYCPDFETMTRQELYREIYSAKNELLAIAMRFAERIDHGDMQPIQPTRIGDFDELLECEIERVRKYRANDVYRPRDAPPPKVDPPPETTFERLQGISTESLDAHIAGYPPGRVDSYLGAHLQSIRERGDQPKHLSVRELSFVRLHIKRACNAGKDFGTFFWNATDEFGIENSADLYDLCTNGGLKPFEGE